MTARALTDAELEEFVVRVVRALRDGGHITTPDLPRRPRKHVRPPVTLTATDLERAATNAARRGVGSRR